MASSGFGYVDRKTPIHQLSGVSKLLMLILVVFSVMMSYDTRYLIVVVILSLIMFRVSKIKFSDMKVLFTFIIVFTVINMVLLFLFAPNQGTAIYGTRHVLFHLIGPYSLTAEQLFYMLNVTLKYFAVLPMALIFISTTNPSEFAESLNRIGVSYKVSYSVALALRYIPDIQRDFRDISQSQQARGVDTSKKAKLFTRIKNITAILMPLVFTSLDRIDVITNAMQLRGFGKHKKRTWYRARSLKAGDFVMIGFSILAVLAAILLFFVDEGRFYNPFQ